MLTIRPPIRRSDDWGSGHFGAPRGSYKHEGVDFACYPQSAVRAVAGGTVTKLGYPYKKGKGAFNSQNPYWYVEITDTDGYAARYLYVQPAVNQGDPVDAGEEIGISQPLARRYPGITEHVHFEVRDPSGELLDPDVYFARLSNGSHA